MGEGKTVLPSLQPLDHEDDNSAISQRIQECPNTYGEGGWVMEPLANATRGESRVLIDPRVYVALG
jgi:hypothetical protein